MVWSNSRAFKHPHCITAIAHQLDADERSEGQDPPAKDPGVIYAIGCTECNKVYVGETARTAE